MATLEQWERTERKRSADEASQSYTSESLAYPRDVTRYISPPPNTIHPLEYAFHLLGDVNGKTILEYGCGDGVNTVVLANRGAEVIALDLSPELIEVARQRLRAHGITESVTFIVGSAHNLPLPDESVDVIFGIAILHHLDLKLSSSEVTRVLRKGGLAIFQEPVRNSRLLRVVRNLIPYRSPDVSPFERPLTDRELAEFGANCSSYYAKSFGLPTSSPIQVLLSAIRRNTSEFVLRWDAALLNRFPWLGYYSPVRVIKMIR